jgi:hypothetical protein
MLIMEQVLFLGSRYLTLLPKLPNLMKNCHTLPTLPLTQTNASSRIVCVVSATEAVH